MTTAEARAELAQRKWGIVNYPIPNSIGVGPIVSTHPQVVNVLAVGVDLAETVQRAIRIAEIKG